MSKIQQFGHFSGGMHAGQDNNGALVLPINDMQTHAQAKAGQFGIIPAQATNKPMPTQNKAAYQSHFSTAQALNPQGNAAAFAYPSFKK
jgi:hypothetical protein